MREWGERKKPFSYFRILSFRPPARLHLAHPLLCVAASAANIQWVNCVQHSVHTPLKLRPNLEPQFNSSPLIYVPLKIGHTHTTRARNKTNATVPCVFARNTKTMRIRRQYNDHERGFYCPPNGHIEMRLFDERAFFIGRAEHTHTHTRTKAKPPAILG